MIDPFNTEISEGSAGRLMVALEPTPEKDFYKVQKSSLFCWGYVASPLWMPAIPGRTKLYTYFAFSYVNVLKRNVFSTLTEHLSCVVVV